MGGSMCNFHLKAVLTLSPSPPPLAPLVVHSHVRVRLLNQRQHIVHLHSDSLEHSQAPIALEKIEYADEKHAKEELSVASAHAHPTHDPDGEIWIHPTPEEISGPNALRRVVDKMSVLSYQSRKLPIQLTDN